LASTNPSTFYRLGSTLPFLAFDFVDKRKAKDMAIIPFQRGPAMAKNLMGFQLPAAMRGLGVLCSKQSWQAAGAGRIKETGFNGE
jgi:hypothetical protein